MTASKNTNEKRLTTRRRRGHDCAKRELTAYRTMSKGEIQYWLSASSSQQSSSPSSSYFSSEAGETAAEDEEEGEGEVTSSSSAPSASSLLVFLRSFSCRLRIWARAAARRCTTLILWFASTEMPSPYFEASNLEMWVSAYKHICLPQRRPQNQWSGTQRKMRTNPPW